MRAHGQARGRLVGLLLAGLIATTDTRADIVSGIGTVPGGGSFQLTVGGVPVASIAPGTAIPRAPGTLGLGGGSSDGTTTGFLAQTFDFSPTTPKVFIPPSPPAMSTSFLSQSIPSPLPGPEPGPAVFHADFNVVYTIDLGGLAAQSLASAYVLTMVVDGSVGFDAVINFSSSALGALDSIDIHFSKVTPGGLVTVVSDTASLPALPGGSTLTLSGYFEMRVDDNPGGSATQIVVQVVPEPSVLALGATALAVCLITRRLRGPTSRRAGEAFTTPPDR